ncbi:MAG TPA: RNA polymerase sigma factor [Kofleriaceae bacterium]|nr:RNA polymerase sigma factor [Kofleriaceae bacterium]
MPAVSALAPPAIPVPRFDEVYERHVGFVWRIARAFGVPASAIEDAVQDVFVVVHRRLPEFEGRAAITTWLFAITKRVAFAHRRRETRTEPLAAEPRSSADPFAAISRAEAAAIVAEILDTLDDDKRIVLALVELEQLSVPEVAQLLEINLNTAYSRLRLARAAFDAAVRRRKP